MNRPAAAQHDSPLAQFKAAIADYETGTVRLIGLVDQLTTAIAALGSKVPRVKI
jgi:hypothetical protein